MYKRIFFGIVPETLKNVRESSRYVIVTMGVIAAFTLILGVYPDVFYKPIINYVEDLYSNSNEIVQLPHKASTLETKVSEQTKGGHDENLKENGYLPKITDAIHKPLLHYTGYM
jgi:formate hydrogenlyase subunit 3/multisubunit Na+/H+ antiporter MnhD subunit